MQELHILGGGFAGVWATMSAASERENSMMPTTEEGKAMKRQINNEWIYPPSPAIGKKAIFEQIGLSAESRR